MSRTRLAAIAGTLLLAASQQAYAQSEKGAEPSLDSLFFQRAEAFAEVGAWDSALASYQKALQLTPALDVAYQKLGSCYVKKGDYRMAIRALDKAIELDSNDYEAYAYRGVALYKMGNFEQGERDLTAAIRINSKFALSYYFLGSLYLAWRRYHEAVAQFDRFSKLGVASSPPYIMYHKRGEAHLRNGDWKEAISDFTQAIELRGGYASGYYHRALAHSRAGSVDQALYDFDQAVKISPRYPQAYYDRAEVHALRGDTASALLDLKRCASQARDAPLRRMAEEKLARMGGASQ